jgi:hypothetical protein
VFFLGGLSGAMGFGRLGFAAAFPLALVLAVLGSAPVVFPFRS